LSVTKKIIFILFLLKLDRRCVTGLQHVHFSTWLYWFRTFTSCCDSWYPFSYFVLY